MSENYNSLTPIPWYVGVNQSVLEFATIVDVLRAFDYRPLSLCLHGTGRAPLFTSIWVKRPGPDWKIRHDFVSESAIEAYVAAETQNGYFPRLVGAYSQPAWPHQKRFAVVVEEGAPVSELEFAYWATFGSKHPEKLAKNESVFLRTCAGFGINNTVWGGLARYALIWEEQPSIGKIFWNYFLGRDPADGVSGGYTFGEQYGALVQGFWRPDLVCITPGGQGYHGNPAQLHQFGPRYFSIWRDDVLNAWSLHAPIDGASLKTLLDNIPAHQMPIRLQATGGPGPDQRFALLAAASDQVVKRTMKTKRVPPPQGTPFPQAALAFQTCDDWVRAYMRQQNIRAGQLAIAYNGRLVHAAAFTFAEPGYPETDNTDVMRIGSISKALTGMAVAHAWGKGLLNPFTEYLENILAPRFPQPWVDDRLGNRTLAQFLSHSSLLIGEGAALGPMQPVPIASVAGKGHITDADWVKYFLYQHPEKELVTATLPPNNSTYNPPPANPPSASYNGAGFWLAGQALAIRAGHKTLAGAMQAPDGFFAALGIKRAKLAQFHPEYALTNSGEALCHAHPGIGTMDYPVVETPPGSGQFVNGPPGPHTYAGMQPVSGASVGTWCLAAADIARVFSIWDLPTNPLFDAANQWLGPTILYRYAAMPGRGLGLGIFRAPNTVMTNPEADPTTATHNGALIGCVALVMRRRFDTFPPATIPNKPPPPPGEALVISLIFNTLRADGDAIYFETEGETLFQLAKAYGAQYGWPGWNLFSDAEIDLPT